MIRLGLNARVSLLVSLPMTAVLAGLGFFLHAHFVRQLRKAITEARLAPGPEGAVLLDDQMQMVQSYLGGEAALAIGVALLLLLALVWLCMRQLTSPLRQLTGHIRQLAGKACDATPLPVRRRDETGELTEAFNQLMARLCQADRELRKLTRAVEQSPTGILITDTEGKIEYVNPAFTKATGYRPEEVLGQNPRLLRSGEQPPEVYRELWETIRSGREWWGEFHNKKKDGTFYWADAVIAPIADEAGRITHYVGEQENITERKRLEEQILMMAHHDSLTGLPNRLLLHDRLQQALAHAGRNGEIVGVMYLDIDHFKRINDTLGHHLGDQVLKGFAGRLEGCVRRSDTVARMGGDEFVIVMAGVAGPEGVEAVARKIIEKMMSPLRLAEREVPVATSIGLALYPLDGEDGETLLKYADLALYAAKRQGRNRYCRYRPAGR